MKFISAFLVSAALAAAFGAAPAGPEHSFALPFVDDQYARALSDARSRHVPLFIEMWAPWCHTCRSMRAFVYTDRTLAVESGKFVWLSIDTEKKENAEVLRKYPVTAWPSMFVVDPGSEKIEYRWTGGATAVQLVKWLSSARGPKSSEPAAYSADLKKADALNGEGKYPEAAAAYAVVLSKAPAKFSDFPRVLDAYLFALQTSGQAEPCAITARKNFGRVARLPNAANVASSGLDCALALPKENSGRADLILYLERDCQAVVNLEQRSPRFAADDISGVYQELIAAREDAKDEKGQKDCERNWIRFLEQAAAAAPNADGRAVFDSHRLSAYVEVGEPQRAIPMLEASEHDLPNDYNPPARLAIAYKAMKEYDKALAASDRALAKAYGPRRLGILRTRAEIYEASGGAEAARKTLQDAIAEAQALPEGQRSDRMIDALKKKLSSLP